MTKTMPSDTYERILVSEVAPGDTIIHDGHHRTVCKKDLGRGFMGVTVFGDSYRLGSIPITRVTYGAQILRQQTALRG